MVRRTSSRDRVLTDCAAVTADCQRRSSSGVNGLGMSKEKDPTQEVSPTPGQVQRLGQFDVALDTGLVPVFGGLFHLSAEGDCAGDA